MLETVELKAIGRAQETIPSKPQDHGTVSGDDCKDSSTSRIELVWRNVIFLTVVQLAGIHLFILIVTGNLALRTFLVGYVYSTLGNLGITAGAHRLWSHKGYRAKLPLKVILLFFQTLASENSCYVWVRDHRMHHKYTETNADPHNIKRGFFFAHIGWLMCKKHPDVAKAGKNLDMKDMEEDPYIMWQHKHYTKLYLISTFVIPLLVFRLFTYENWFYCFLYGNLGRYAILLNITWMINSYAHFFGNKPYDRNIRATNSILLGIIGQGEGYHNYHHVFPWDYRASELRFNGLLRGFNLTTLVIDFFGLIGWAYDLKTVSPDVIKQRALRTGDGTHYIWGWGDKDMPQEHIKMATKFYPADTKNSKEN